MVSPENVQNLYHEPSRVAVTNLQHSKSFDQPLLFGPCVHTIHLKDLSVPE